MEGGMTIRLTASGSGSAVGGLLSHATLGIVNVNTAKASAVVDVYDGQSTTGTKVASIDASSKGSNIYLIRCENGVYAQLTGATADVTVTVF